jgi:hypothetical protein
MCAAQPIRLFGLSLGGPLGRLFLCRFTRLRLRIQECLYNLHKRRVFGCVMSHDELAYPAKLKIGRAKQHINELWLDVEKFMKPRPFRLVVKHRPQANEFLLVTKRDRPIPDPWSLIIGDIVHNLWSALDLAIYSMASDKAPDPHALMFPFVREEKSLEGKIKSAQVCFAGTNVVRYIRTLEPYRDGNPVLSGIFRLDTRDKHRLLIPALQILDFNKASLRAVIPGSPPLNWPDHISTFRFPHPDADEVQLFKGPADYRAFEWYRGPWVDHEEETYIQPPYRIAFGEGQPFEGLPIIPTLKDCAYVIEGIVDRLFVHFRSPANIR